MANRWGNKTTSTSVLYHCYDPRNYKSYTGSGSTLTDMGTQGVDGTIVASPTYTSNRFALNGSTQYVNLDGVDTISQGYSAFTVAGWVSPTDATPASTEYIFSISDTNANEYFGIYMATDGKIGATLVDAGTTQWTFESDSAVFADATWANFYFEHDGVAPVMFIDGASEAITFSVSTDKTKSTTDLAGTDNTRWGCLNVNSGGNTNFFTGDIGSLFIYQAQYGAASATAFYTNTVDWY